MIQILGLRSFVPKGDTKEKKYDAFYEKLWRAESVKELFANIDKHIDQIPADDRFNIFYTVANCHEGKREFKHQDVMVFDIDKIDVKQLDQYIPTVCKVLEVSADKTGIVFSGHGLHFIIGLQKRIAAKEYFKNNKPHYSAVCRKINKALLEAGLSGECDSSVFEPRRILRLPKTINRKPNKPDVMADFLNAAITPIDFCITKISGVEALKPTDAIDTKILARYPDTDNDAIMEECGFLKSIKDNPNDVAEPEWYAALSITARMQGGHELSHKLSQGYKGYSASETEEKIAQAMESSGPRTCESINRLYGKCYSCPHWEKVKSPILIRSKDHIQTEKTGFHNIFIKGSDAKYIPNLEDLRKYYAREHHYKILSTSKLCYVYNGKHYELVGDNQIDGFAYEKFEPKVKPSLCKSFRDAVQMSNIMHQEWFHQSTQNLMNFQNGVLNLRTLDFTEHCKDYGFRSILPYAYDKEAKCPTFDAMLARVTKGNADLQNLLLEFMGYALSNDAYWNHKALVLQGDGANGKSTFIRVLQSLAGTGNYATLSMNELRSEYNRQLLDGKLFNISEETPSRALADTSHFKTLTAGGETQVRSIYKEPYFMRNKAKMIFSCNELPDVEDITHGLFRRLLIAPFVAKFTQGDDNFDPHINDKLDKELSGIFNRVLDGYHRLCKNKDFTNVDAVSRAVATFKEEVDNVERWVNENLIFFENGQRDKHFIALARMYEKYKIDMEAETEKVLSKIKFLKRLRKLMPKLEHNYHVKKLDRQSVKGYLGLAFVNEIDHVPSPSESYAPPPY